MVASLSEQPEVLMAINSNTRTGTIPMALTVLSTSGSNSILIHSRAGLCISERCCYFPLNRLDRFTVFETRIRYLGLCCQ